MEVTGPEKEGPASASATSRSHGSEWKSVPLLVPLCVCKRCAAGEPSLVPGGLPAQRVDSEGASSCKPLTSVLGATTNRWGSSSSRRAILCGAMEAACWAEPCACRASNGKGAGHFRGTGSEDPGLCHKWRKACATAQRLAKGTRGCSRAFSHSAPGASLLRVLHHGSAAVAGPCRAALRWGPPSARPAPPARSLFPAGPCGSPGAPTWGQASSLKVKTWCQRARMGPLRPAGRGSSLRHMGSICSGTPAKAHAETC